MAALTTVAPDGSSIVDLEPESRESRRPRGYGYKSGSESDTTISAGVRKRLAGRGEARLGDCVVLGAEFESHCVADRRRDIGGAV